MNKQEQPSIKKIRANEEKDLEQIEGAKELIEEYKKAAFKYDSVVYQRNHTFSERTKKECDEEMKPLWEEVERIQGKINDLTGYNVNMNYYYNFEGEE